RRWSVLALGTLRDRLRSDMIGPFPGRTSSATLPQRLTAHSHREACCETCLTYRAPTVPQSEAPVKPRVIHPAACQPVARSTGLHPITGWLACQAPGAVLCTAAVACPACQPSPDYATFPR